MAEGTRLGSELSPQGYVLGRSLEKGGAAGTGRPSPVSAVAYGFGVACGVHVTSLLSSVPLTR